MIAILTPLLAVLGPFAALLLMAVLSGVGMVAASLAPAAVMGAGRRLRED